MSRGLQILPKLFFYSFTRTKLNEISRTHKSSHCILIIKFEAIYITNLWVALKSMAAGSLFQFIYKSSRGF